MHNIQLMITVLLALAGWLVVHWFTVQREIQQKQREVRVKYLREAYLKIANLCDRGDFPGDIADLQDAFNDIQLFGKTQQIERVGQAITALDTGKDADFNELLKQLRNEIREHIGLQSIDDYRWYIRHSQNK